MRPDKITKTELWTQQQEILSRLRDLENRSPNESGPAPPGLSKPFPDSRMPVCPECDITAVYAPEGPLRSVVAICPRCDRLLAPIDLDDSDEEPDEESSRVGRDRERFGASAEECCDYADGQPLLKTPKPSKSKMDACDVILRLLFAMVLQAMRKGDPARAFFYGRMWCGLLVVRDGLAWVPTHDTDDLRDLRQVALTGKLPDIWARMFG